MPREAGSKCRRFSMSFTDDWWSVSASCNRQREPFASSGVAGGKTDRRTDGRTVVKRDIRVDGRTEGQAGGWSGRGTDGWMEVRGRRVETGRLIKTDCYLTGSEIESWTRQDHLLSWRGSWCRSLSVSPYTSPLPIAPVFVCLSVPPPVCPFSCLVICLFD